MWSGLCVRVCVQPSVGLWLLMVLLRAPFSAGSLLLVMVCSPAPAGRRGRRAMLFLRRRGAWRHRKRANLRQIVSVVVVVVAFLSSARS